MIYTSKLPTRSRSTNSSKTQEMHLLAKLNAERKEESRATLLMHGGTLPNRTKWGSLAVSRVLRLDFRMLIVEGSGCCCIVSNDYVLDERWSV